MIKIDFEKVKKVLLHKENKINHIGPIHKLIGLFKNKWEGCSLIDGHYNELITLEKELIEKIHGIKNN